MIILKGQVPHTTHSYTKHSQKKKKKKKKKLVEKERQQKKAKYTSIKQRKGKAHTKLSDNWYSVSSTEEAQSQSKILRLEIP